LIIPLQINDTQIFMEKNLFGQDYAPESVSDQLLLQLNGIEFSDSFIEILRRTEQRANTFRRFYKEEHLEEIQLLTFLRDILQEISHLLEICPGSITYDFDDIWLQKNKAILLAILLDCLLAEIPKGNGFGKEPQIKIQCRFQYGKLEFLYGIVGDTDPLFKNLSPHCNSLIETVVRMLNGKSSFHAEENFCFELSFKNA